MSKKPSNNTGTVSFVSSARMKSLRKQATLDEIFESKGKNKKAPANPNLGRSKVDQKAFVPRDTSDEAFEMPHSGTRGEKPRCYKRGNKPFFKRAS